MKEVYLPGDQPIVEDQEMNIDIQLPDEVEGMWGTMRAERPLDMSPEARLARSAAVQGRLAAGEAVELNEVNPKTHCPEIVALVHQRRRYGQRAEF